MSGAAAASGITAVSRASASPSMALMSGEQKQVPVGEINAYRHLLHGADF